MGKIPKKKKNKILFTHGFYWAIFYGRSFIMFIFDLLQNRTMKLWNISLYVIFGTGIGKIISIFTVLLPLERKIKLVIIDLEEKLWWKKLTIWISVVKVDSTIIHVYDRETEILDILFFGLNGIQVAMIETGLWTKNTRSMWINVELCKIDVKFL